jgi:drug/metabolite transporter (DMT)-like permease
MGLIKTLKEFWPFILFAALIACRDISYELYFSGYIVPSLFSFVVCFTIVILSLGSLIVKRRINGLLLKLKEFRILLRVVFLGITAAIIYYITFYLIDKIGAGLFNLVDYGFSPLFTMLLGIVYFKERTYRYNYIPFVFFLLGLVLINIKRDWDGIAYIGIALISPVCTAMSDYLSKWLLDVNRGNLSKDELLFVRFLPASAILLLIYLLDTSQPQNSIDIYGKIGFGIAAVVLGFLPLYILCIGLLRHTLTSFAIWEFLIPALAFFVTYFYRNSSILNIEVFGAVLMLIGVIVSQMPSNAKPTKK